jgi:hypothetical protein
MKHVVGNQNTPGTVHGFHPHICVGDPVVGDNDVIRMKIDPLGHILDKISINIILILSKMFLI